ncbi:Leucine-rich repeat receptor-like protein kinase PXL1 [Fagus crenata]
MAVNTHPLLNGAWRHIQEGNPEVDALDEEVRENSYLEKMCCVVTLGIICTCTQPSTRPSMKEVLQDQNMDLASPGLDLPQQLKFLLNLQWLLRL